MSLKPYLYCSLRADDLRAEAPTILVTTETKYRRKNNHLTQVMRV
jgi:hypothetical protein